MSGAQRSVWLWMTFVVAGCGGSAAVGATAPAQESAGAEDPSESAAAELATLPPTPEEPTTPAEAEPRQGDVVEAGVIARGTLNDVLNAGIPRFLQRVRVEAHSDGGRFVGWRLIALFDDAQVATGPIRTGDTVLGVNGRTIERPEQFLAVWETLASATQLTFQMLRAGQAYEVRYAIED